MDFIRIDNIIKAKGILNMTQLAKDCEIPVSTLAHWINNNIELTVTNSVLIRDVLKKYGIRLY